MTNRIISLAFDPASFPLAPNFIQFEIRESNTQVTIITDSPSQRPDDFLVLFARDERATAPLLPYETYHLEAKMLEGEDKYKIEFAFSDSSDKIKDTVVLDAYAYLEEYQNAYKREYFKNGSVDENIFERDYGIAYLKNIFGDKIEGNDAFWLKFHEELDGACVPLNCIMDRLIEGFPEKPIVIRTMAENPEIKHAPPARARSYDL